MSLNGPTFNYQIKSIENDFPPFTEAFGSFCEEQNVAADKIFDLQVSLEELIVNSFTHGSTSEPVKIMATIDEQQLKIIIEDRAPPFNLLREAPPPPEGSIEARQVGGLGIHLVKNLNDRVEYSGSQTGNKITLLKNIK